MKSPRLVLVCCVMASVLAVGACAGPQQTQPTSAPTVGSTPPAAVAAGTPAVRYMADAVQDGHSMAIGISVDGDSVAAYACNGVDDEAWFFGKTRQGAIPLTSKFRDTLSADTRGANLTGTLDMNGVEYPFTALPVSGPAGMYTAAVNNTRASWIVRPDKSVTAVQFDVGT